VAKKPAEKKQTKSSVSAVKTILNSKKKKKKTSIGKSKNSRPKSKNQKRNVGK
jgi:hypothetical protein